MTGWFTDHGVLICPAPPDDLEGKICKSCGERKSLDEFSIDKRKRDGKYSSCRKCSNEVSRKSKKNNPETIKEWKRNNPEYNKKYYKDNSEKILKKTKEWQKNNPEKVNEKNKKWAENNPEKVKESSKKYIENNPDKVKESRRKTKKKNREKNNKKNREYRKNNPEIIRKWKQSNIGKISKNKSQAKRKRELGYVPLNNWFEGCEGHHVDKEQVIHIPADMHKGNRHRQSNPESMNEINRLAFEFMEGNSYKP